MNAPQPDPAADTARISIPLDVAQAMVRLLEEGGDGAWWVLQALKVELAHIDGTEGA